MTVKMTLCAVKGDKTRKIVYNKGI